MENKDVVISTRITKKEFLLLQEKAEKENKRVADYVRFLIIEHLAKSDNIDFDLDEIMEI